MLVTVDAVASEGGEVGEAHGHAVDTALEGGRARRRRRDRAGDNAQTGGGKGRSQSRQPQIDARDARQTRHAGLAQGPPWTRCQSGHHPRGRDAIGVEHAAKKAGSGDRAAENMPMPPPRSSRPRQLAAESSPHRQPDPTEPNAAPRAGSKLALVTAMLAKPEGATIAALVSATGWQPHTARAVLTGLRKRDFAIERARANGGTTSIYRIAATAAPAA